MGIGSQCRAERAAPVAYLTFSVIGAFEEKGKGGVGPSPREVQRRPAEDLKRRDDWGIVWASGVESERRTESDLRPTRPD